MFFKLIKLNKGKLQKKEVLVKVISSLLISLNFLALALGVSVSVFYTLVFLCLFLAAFLLFVYSARQS